MFVYCECCVLSGRGLCDGPIPRPEESYRLWCVTVCDQINNKPLHLTWLGRKWLSKKEKINAWKSEKRRNYSDNLGVNGRIILKWILNKRFGNVAHLF
jgi:hypothetical protein